MKEESSPPHFVNHQRSADSKEEDPDLQVAVDKSDVSDISDADRLKDGREVVANEADIVPLCKDT